MKRSVYPRAHMKPKPIRHSDLPEIEISVLTLEITCTTMVMCTNRNECAPILLSRLIDIDYNETKIRSISICTENHFRASICDVL